MNFVRTLIAYKYFSGPLELIDRKRSAVIARMEDLAKAPNQRQKSQLNPTQEMLSLYVEVRNLREKIGLQENANMLNIIPLCEDIDSEYFLKQHEARKQFDAVCSQADTELQTTLSDICREFAQAIAA